MKDEKKCMRKKRYFAGKYLKHKQKYYVKNCSKNNFCQGFILVNQRKIENKRKQT